jgi:hypothetical protein
MTKSRGYVTDDLRQLSGADLRIFPPADGVERGLRIDHFVPTGRSHISITGRDHDTDQFADS